MNRVFLYGNLGADPEVLNTKSGSVLKMRIATTERVPKKNSDKWEERTEWHRVTLFGENRVDALADILQKGMKVLITGRVAYSQYEDEETGETRYSTDIIAIDVELPGKGSGGKSKRRDDEDEQDEEEEEGNEDEQDEEEEERPSRSRASKKKGSTATRKRGTTRR